jgi:hypothetical protein
MALQWRTGALAAAALLWWGSGAGAADSFTTVQLTPTQQMQATSRAAQRASVDQRAIYREKLRRIRTHHLILPTRIAVAPFATTLSANKQVIKPKDEALLSDGIDVKQKIDATSRAKMDYNFVSPVAEPSSAIVRDNILITFNWGAIWSKDAGKTFDQLDPFALFGSPKPAIGNGFCCDQLAIYDAKHDLLVWLLQGSDNESGNTIRLLYAKGADIAAQRWHVQDFSPRSIGNWDGEWFDYPDMALSDQHLFISFNTFLTTGDRGYTRSVVLRFPLSELASYGVVRVGAFSSDSGEDFSPRFTQGARDRMFWATHRDTSSLIIRSWPDNAPQPDRRKVINVERWTRPDEQTVAPSKGPNKMPWLSRLDERITAGWLAQNLVGFGWTSGAISSAAGGAVYPFPHVRVALVPRSELEKESASVIKPDPGNQPHIWSSKFAMAYAAAAPNTAGEIGLGVFFGGPKHYPSTAVGIFRKDDGGWKSTLTILSEGKNTPRCLTETGIDNACGAWGDYIGIRAHPTNPEGWYVAAHTSEDLKKKEKPKVVVTFSPFGVKTKNSAQPIARFDERILPRAVSLPH